jgi:flavin reductase (DIM6/NTAB) family NADH-FMN oxidoreductase RutF
MEPGEADTASGIIDAKAFWGIVGQRAIGVSIITARDPDGPAGFLGLSAAHVCADPPTMLVSIDKRTSALSAVLNAKHFAISYLPRHAENVAVTFSGKTAAKGADRFESGQWTTLTTGAPVFADAIGAVDCVLEETIERYGVIIAIGRVVNLARSPGEPLIYFRGEYR